MTIINNSSVLAKLLLDLRSIDDYSGIKNLKLVYKPKRRDNIMGII